MRTATSALRCSRCRTSKPRLAAVAPERVGGVGDLLQLAQHELRARRAVPSRNPLSHTLHDAAVDDHRGVEDLVRLPAARRVAGKSFADMASSSSRLASATVAPRYASRSAKSPRPSGPAPGTTAPTAEPEPEPERHAQRCPPTAPQKSRSTGTRRACHSSRTARTPARKPAPPSHDVPVRQAERRPEREPRRRRRRQHDQPHDDDAPWPTSRSQQHLHRLVHRSHALHLERMSRAAARDCSGAPRPT